jgi:hypothetical protein
MGSGCINSYFLALCTSWGWVVSFMLVSLYSRRKNHRYPKDKRLGRRQSRHGLRTFVVQPVVSRYADYAIPYTLYNWYVVLTVIETIVITIIGLMMFLNASVYDKLFFRQKNAMPVYTEAKHREATGSQLRSTQSSLRRWLDIEILPLTLICVSGHKVCVPPPPQLFDRLPNRIQVSINLIMQVCE